MATSAPVVTPAQGVELLQLARNSLESWVRHGRKLVPALPPQGALATPLGSFVTIHGRDGDLRGCIGHMVPSGPLALEVIELAIAAGVHDPRFEPVTARELPALTYEVSVLSPMQVASAEEVVPGKHGLLIRQGHRSGVLLPQVAAEHHWDRETFLQQTCRKAGLPPDAWRDAGTELRVFTAQVFSESARH